MTAKKAGMLRSLGIALVLVGLPAIAGIAAGEIQDRQSAKLQRTADALVLETQLLKSTRPELGDYDEVRVSLLSRSTVMESLAADRFVLAGLMESLSDIPDEITLHAIRFERGMLEIEGAARNELAIDSLVVRMRDMPGWKDVVVLMETEVSEKLPIFHISARQSVDLASRQDPVR